MIKVIETDSEGNIVSTFGTDEKTIKDDYLKRPNIFTYPEGTVTTGMKVDIATGKLVEIPFVEPTALQLLCDEIACAPKQFLERLVHAEQGAEVISQIQSALAAE